MTSTVLAVLKASSRKPPPSIGRKAEHLHQLMRLGVRVPVTYVIPWELFERYRQDDLSVVEALRRSLGQALDSSKAYAVRSSANLEDHFEQSFAGQFKSVLNVRGVDAVIQAIWSIWGTTDSAAVQQYVQRLPENQRRLRMAVIVQEMVNPVVSGVAFSRNPLTGLDETIVEAVRGPGTLLVQDGSTPAHWVNKWGSWIETPPESGIPLELISRVVDETQTVAKRLKAPLDLEWVFDGQQLYWVQFREITALHSPNIYSNRIAKDMLPGIIKPLIWSVNIPLVNGAWVRVLTEMVGQHGIHPEELARPFYYRAYFNMGALGRIFRLAGLPEQSLEMMNGIAPKEAGKPAFRPSAKTFLLLPRLIGFAINRWNFARKFRKDIPALASRIKTIHWQQTSELTDQQLQAEIERLYALVQEMAYYNINIPLLMLMYNATFNRQLAKLGVDFARFDLEDGLTGLEDYHPGFHLKKLNQVFRQLDPAVQQAIRETSYSDLPDLPGAAVFSSQLVDFLERFGHLSDSGNDFSIPLWRESPEMILKLVLDHPESSEPSDGKLKWADLPVKGLRKKLVHLFYQRTRQFRVFREQISSKYTYTYGLFRVYFLEIGRRLVNRGLLQAPGDVFYLTNTEALSALAFTGSQENQSWQTLAARRKAEIEAVREVNLPVVIYGEVAPPVNANGGKILSGTPTSRGYYTGTVKVVLGIEDFNKLEHGDVLVVPYSDVGWTPLFSRAGAVVAESGGLLSHSSIIAREYGIPAVVSVPQATRLKDHSRVIVDGFKGEVILVSAEDDAA